MANGELTIRERLERIDDSIGSLTKAVAALQLLANTTATRVATGASIAAILLSATIGGYVYKSQQNRDTAERELCAYVDNEHNRLRGDILRGEQLLYQVPAFRVLVRTPVAEQTAYDSARGRYEAIVASRPGFCSPSSNPVAPFPALRDFRHP